MTGENSVDVPFQAHADLLKVFLVHREAVVERLQDLLNAQRKPTHSLQDRTLLSRDIESCFFTLAAVTSAQAGLSRQLEEAHWASGFRPSVMPQLHNDLIDAAEMMARGFYCWQQTRWPGRNARIQYAHNLFNLFLLRRMELLSMRLWDGGTSGIGDRLLQLQDLLDELRQSSPAGQPVLVRDARWLIPLAQSPTTDELSAYMEVAEQVTTFPAAADSLEIQKAHLQMIGGHLRSQIRHYCIKDGLSLDDASVIRRTRTTNALDFALLIQCLVPLLGAYETARTSGDDESRHTLAGVICQGISVDPELFLNRVDLLGAYSMMEHLFIETTGDGRVAYTSMGRRHIELLREYKTRIRKLSSALHEDYSQFRPVDGSYSPYGAIYGTPTNLTENMALKSLQRDTVTGFSMEDVFTDGDAAKLAWVDGWRKLPHVPLDVQELYAYPQQFAEEIFDRIGQALDRSVSNVPSGNATATGRVFALPGDDLPAGPEASQIADLPIRYIASSDLDIVSAEKASAYDQMQLLSDRQEGHFLLSFETAGGWIAIRKDMLTEVLGAGLDAKIAELPVSQAQVLSLMCPDIDVVQASMPPSMLNA